MCCIKNILWFDDEPQQGFIDYAESKGFHIDVAENVDLGIAKYKEKEKVYHAIILDVNNVKKNLPNQEKGPGALNYAINKLTESKINLPWFVYTGGNFEGEKSIDIVLDGFDRPYASKQWYKKPQDIDCLLGDIDNALLSLPEFNTISKYPDIFSWYPRQKDLFSILEFLEDEKKYISDYKVLNMIRSELEELKKTLYESGILLEDYNEGSKLNEISQFLGQSVLCENGLVPKYIQRSFHSLCVITNDGSHPGESKYDIQEGIAPYLIRSSIYEFLNILHWLGGYAQNTDNAETLRARIMEMVNPKDGVQSYLVEKDKDGNYHCGEYLLSTKEGSEFLGKTVSVNSITDNKSKSKDIYPHFARAKLV